MACTSQLQVIVSIMLWMATRRAALNALPRVSTAGMAPTLRISLMAQVSFIGLSTSAFTLCAPKPTNGAKKPDAPAKPVKPAAKRGRSASAPHTRPPAPAEPAISQLPLVLDGELYPLPDGKDYQSADELDGPAHVLEEEELVGLEPRAPIQSPEGAPAFVTRIKHKKEGDGFQCDAIAEDGYTITFWFRCDKLPCTPEAGVSDRDTRC